MTIADREAHRGGVPIEDGGISNADDKPEEAVKDIDAAEFNTDAGGAGGGDAVCGGGDDGRDFAGSVGRKHRAWSPTGNLALRPGSGKDEHTDEYKGSHVHNGAFLT